MISAYIYQDLYLLLVTILTIFTSIHYSGLNPSRIEFCDNKSSIIPSLFITICIVLYIGTRPVSIVFPDMSGYVAAVENGYFDLDNIRWDTNYVFVPLMVLMSSLKFSGTAAMIVIAAIYFGAALIAMRKFFPNDTYLAMLVFLAAFTTFSSATNGMKAGCATTLFLCAIAYRDNWITSLLFLVLSLGFHHAAQLLIAVFVVCSLYKNTGVYIIVWGVCLILALLHVTYFQTFFGGITDEQGAGYLLLDATSTESNWGGKIGFRYDFVLYSIVPILLGYYLVIKKDVKSSHFQFCINVYLLANAIWMLCMYAPYTNRIAALGWGLYPVLMIFPFLKTDWSRRQYVYLVYSVMGCLFFTLFMHFIYY